MATSISTLAYRIVADTSKFTQGITATKRELSTAKRIIEASASPIQKLQSSMAGLDNLYKKGTLTTKQYFGAIKKVNDEYMKASGELVKLNTGTDKLNANMKDTGKHASGLGKISGSIKSAVAGYASWQTAIALVNRGLEERNQLEAERLKTQMTLGDAQRDMMINLGDVSPEVAGRFAQDVATIGRGAGLKSAAPAFEAAGQVLSSTGGDRDLTKMILKESLPFFAHKPGAAPEFAKASAFISTMTGAKTAGDVQESIGLILTAMEQMQITGLEQFPEAAQAAAATLASDTSGNTMQAAQESLSAFAAIGGAGKEALGAQTKTGIVNLSTMLGELLPEVDTLIKKGSKFETIKGTGLTGLAGRVKYTQERAKTDEEFAATVRGMSFGRGAVDKVIKQLLLDPSSEASQRFDAASQKIRPDASVAQRILGNVRFATPQTAAGEFMRRGEGIIEAGEEGAPTTGTARELTKSTLRKTRGHFFDYVTDAAAMRLFDTIAPIAGGDVTGKALLKARELSRGGAAQTAYSLMGWIGGAGGTAQSIAGQLMKPSKMSGDEKTTIREQINNMSDMAEQAKKQTELLKVIAGKQPGVIEEADIETAAVGG